MSSSTTTTATTQPKITLYTNHACPWAQRAHVALNELKIPFEEIIIDLETPREQWYLDINPRGLVPTIRYRGDGIDETVTESAIVAQFLAEAHPSHLLPTSGTPAAAGLRARINFFVDTFFGKVNPGMFKIISENDKAAMETKSEELVKLMEKEIEPLLKDANPFFGGSKDLTLAEVQTISFVLRYHDFSDDVIFPKTLAEGLNKLPNFSNWSKATRSHPSVTATWQDAETRRQQMQGRLHKYKAPK